ncbi:hypothetical protein B1219_18910 [Pseudomonas ogarae]|nr:hypothetical protein B1219_18910 [Pseudomonas ogarae]OPG80370.1 hypothetical protein B1218_05480 [Pseudomonas ogarae]
MSGGESWAAQFQCGSELARDSGGSACINIKCAAVFASKLCSHRRNAVSTKNQVGYKAASGMPSLGEAPSGGAKAFCLLLTGPASGLFKSEPL